MAQPKKNPIESALNIEWVDEVPSPRFGNHTAISEERAQLIDVLKKKSGVWAKIPRSDYGLINSVRSGYSGFTPRGAFQASARETTKDGKIADVYVRYVGEGNEE